MKMGVSVYIFNIRRLKAEIQAIGKLTEETIVRGFCKTWLKEKDKQVIRSLDGSTEVPPLENTHRRQGGVKLVRNSLLSSQ